MTSTPPRTSYTRPATIRRRYRQRMLDQTHARINEYICRAALAGNLCTDLSTPVETDPYVIHLQAEATRAVDELWYALKPAQGWTTKQQQDAVISGCTPRHRS